MRIVFMGTPEFSVPVLQGLIDNYQVVGVVCQPDKEVGRKKEIVFSPIKKLALANNIEVIQPEKIRVDYQAVLDLKPDMIITCAYGQIIPNEILDYPRLGAINVHGSLLPKLRGGAPIHWALINGEKTTGITIMYMAEKMDNGDMISQQEYEILASDNVGILHEKLSIIGKDLLLKTLPSIINGTNKRLKQDEKLVTFGLNIKKIDEIINFNDHYQNVINKIRGLSPFPGGYAMLNGERIKLYNSKYYGEKTADQKPGEIINVTKEGFIIATNNGLIIIDDIQLFGKRRMLVKELINGLKKEDYIGKILG